MLAVEVMFFKISENKNPSKITCYMVQQYMYLRMKIMCCSSIDASQILYAYIK